MNTPPANFSFSFEHFICAFLSQVGAASKEKVKSQILLSHLCLGQSKLVYIYIFFFVGKHTNICTASQFVLLCWVLSITP